MAGTHAPHRGTHVYELEVTLDAPVGVQYRVTTTGGVNGITGTLETARYAAARDRLTITISAGVSSITIR